jgi:uroporphyrinogen decarboxylase
MTGRERELAAIRHEVPDRIPVDVIVNETLPALAGHLGIPEDQVDIRLGRDGRILWPEYLGELPLRADGRPISPWGTVTDGQSYDTERPYPLAPDATVREIEDYAWPDPARFDYAGTAATARMLGRDFAVRGPGWTPLFCRACDLIGMENALVAMAVEPVRFDALLDNIFVRSMEVFRRLLDACGDAMPIFTMGDDFATQRGMLMSPELWRKFLKPRYAGIFAMAKAKGKHVWFHSCGDVTAVLGDFVDIGVDVWETVQLHTLPMTPRELKREYGRHLTFFGGINTQRLPFATPEQIRAEVADVIRALGEGGGFICGPDHHTKPDVPPQNSVALFDAATSFRAAGYTAAG